MEYISFDPETGVLRVPTNEGVYLATAENTCVYSHPYELRGADHIFVTTNPREGEGVYIFRIGSDSFMDRFSDLVEALLLSEFDMIEQDFLPECDQIQFDKTVEQAIAKISFEDLERPWEVT